MDNPYWSKAFLLWLEKVEFPSTGTRDTLDLLLEQYDMIRKLFLKTSTKVRGLHKRKEFKNKAKLLRGIPGIGPLTTV